MWLIGRVLGRRRGSPPAFGREDVTFKWGRLERRMAAQFAADTEAFLSGHLAERAEVRGEDVPVWAWTNLLAHGSEEDLRALSAETFSRWNWTMNQWREARSYVANDVLRRAEQSGSLVELQEMVLVPLEMDLVRNGEVARWKPGQWVKAVEKVLTEQRPVGGRD